MKIDHILINSYKNVAGGYFTQLCLIDENILVYYKSNNIDLVILNIENLKLKVIQKIEYIHDFPYRIIKGNSEQEFISQDIYGITKIWKKDNNSNMFNCLKKIRFSMDSSVFDHVSYTYTDLLIINDILITKCKRLFFYDIKNDYQLKKTFDIYTNDNNKDNFSIIDKKNKIFSVNSKKIYIFKIYNNDNIQLCANIYLGDYDCYYMSTFLFKKKYILISNNIGNLFILNSYNYKLIDKLKIKKAISRGQEFIMYKLNENSFAIYNENELKIYKA